jgi:elongation factor P
MRDIKSGLKTVERFRTQDTIEKLNVDELECTYLFAEGETMTLMDTSTYEQIIVPKELAGDGFAFLKDNMTVTLDLVEGKPVALHLPPTVVMEVVQADAVVKGQTASSSYKPAILENGVRIMVPPHIEAGTRVVVNTSDLTYVERAKG